MMHFEIKSGNNLMYTNLIISRVNISRVKPKLNSSESMFTFVGGNPRRNLLKIIFSSEKFFEDGQDVQNLQTF